MQPDPALAPLSVTDARWLVVSAASALRVGGAEVTYDGAGMLLGMDGRRYGLANLAALLGVTPRRKWASVVHDHVTALIRANANPAPQSLADVASIILPRLTATGPLSRTGSPTPSYAPEFAPNLHILAALDYPSHVSTLAADTALDPFGGWEEVAPVAYANLRGLPAPVHHVLMGSETQPDSGVHIFESEDYHGASRVLLLTDLLTQHAGIECPEFGVLFIVPDRHLLAAHPMSGDGVVAATRLLVDIVLTEYGTTPGMVSPHLYYRAPDGTVEQLSQRQGSGLVMGVSGRFGQALTDLGLLG